MVARCYLSCDRGAESHLNRKYRGAFRGSVGNGHKSTTATDHFDKGSVVVAEKFGRNHERLSRQERVEERGDCDTAGTASVPGTKQEQEGFSGVGIHAELEERDTARGYKISARGAQTETI